MKRSLTQNTHSRPCDSLNLARACGQDTETQKASANGSALRTGAAMLGIAALSMGATTGLLLAMQGEEAIAAEFALAQPLIQHRVQSGDTLWDLSQTYGVSAEAIAASNSLQEDSVLPVGQTLNIPVVREFPTQAVTLVALAEPTDATAPAAAADDDEMSQPPAVVLPDGTVNAIAKETKTPVIVAAEPAAAPVTVAIAPTATPQPPAAPTVVEPDARTHAVASGETIEALAQQYQVPADEILALNREVEPTNLQIGQEIRIPEAATAAVPAATEDAIVVAQAQTARANTVITPPGPGNHIQRLKDDVMRMRQEIRAQSTGQPIITPSPAAIVTTDAPTPVDPNWERQQLNKPSRTEARRPVPATPTAPTPDLVAVAPAPSQGYNRLLNLPAGQSVEPQIPPLLEQDQYLPDRPQEFNGYIWPARGVLTSGYGPRWGRMHRGIDIAAPIGTPVYAAASGVVMTAGWNNGGYGYFVEIRHPDGSLTRYAHNSQILVRKGDRVEQGQQISLMGSTGFSTGPHLHFEIHPPGSGAVNPMAYLPSNRE